MNKVIGLVFLCFGLLSCGLELERGGQEPISNLGIGEALSSDGRQLLASEKNIANRICQAYRSKRFNYTGMIQTPFIFLLEEEKCDGEVRSNQIDTNLAQVLQSSPMVFDSSNTNPYFKNVETEQHGELSGVCASILVGDNVSTVESLSSGQIKGYNFFQTSDGHDAVTINIAAKGQNNNEYIVNLSTEFVVETAPNSGSQRGLILRRTQAQNCTNNNRKEITKQTFLRN